MATTYPRSPPVMFWSTGRIAKPVGMVTVLMHTRNPINQIGAARIQSSCKCQVFEDNCEGIICYRDESGELICEGYDEGPRFYRKLSRTALHHQSRDAEIIHLLQQNWAQITEDGALYKPDMKLGLGVALQEDFN